MSGRLLSFECHIKVNVLVDDQSVLKGLERLSSVLRYQYSIDWLVTTLYYKG